MPLPLPPQGLAATEPDRAVLGTEQTLNLLPDDGQAHSSVLVAHDRIEAVGDPQAAHIIGRSYTSNDNSGDNSQVPSRLQRGLQAWFGEPIETVTRPNPDVAFAIGEHGKHRSRGQSVRVTVGIRDILKAKGGPYLRVFGMGDTAQTVRLVPQRTVVIENELPTG